MGRARADLSSGDAPIGRGESARTRVLAAALKVLADEGSAGFSMQAVARRAGASKATVYRHWSSAGALLVDAMDRTFRPYPPPETGSLEGDVEELLHHQFVLVSGGEFPRLMAAFVDAAERDPTLAGLHAELTRRRRLPLLEVLARAQRSGEIRPDADLELVADLLVAPLFYNRFIAHRPIPDTRPGEVVAHVLRAVRQEQPPGPA